MTTNTESKPCIKYVNPYGTIFIDCNLTDNNHMILNSNEAYEEELLFCPFCGRELTRKGPDDPCGQEVIRTRK